MAIKTTIEQLEEVQDAITKVMSGQVVELNGKRWTGATLFRLQQREDILLARYHREQGRGLSVNYGIPRRD